MSSTNDMLIEADHEVSIDAPIERAYESMLYYLTEGNLGADDREMQLELEKKPGGRWYRNLGDGRGHLWGFVQSIREPDLIELSGPMFMSNPVTNHIIVRFEETGGATKLTFRHRAFGIVELEHSDGIKQGWQEMIDRVVERAKGGASA